MKINFKKGFTLIELLVVVAIIGLLASVVLASLTSARAKGADAAIKADLTTIRNQAALYYDGAGAQSYGAVASCTFPPPGSLFSNTTIVAAYNHAQAQAGTGNVSCSSQGADSSRAQTFAVAALLKSGGTYCVDSSGNGKVGAFASAAQAISATASCN